MKMCSNERNGRDEDVRIAEENCDVKAETDLQSKLAKAIFYFSSEIENRASRQNIFIVKKENGLI
jgi:hypothetical protein